MSCYTGEVLSEGVAIGKAHTIKRHVVNSTNKEPSKEKARLDKAIKNSIQELEDLKKRNVENKEYISMQILLLSDPILIQKTSQQVDTGLSAEESISLVLNEYMNSLLDATSSYLKERVFDLSDIKERILRNLSGKKLVDIDEECIVIAEELHPSFLIQNQKKLLGIITEKGGYSSHAAILCRQFHIPYMISNLGLEENELLIMDTRKKQIISSPKPEEIEHYKQVLYQLSLETYEAIPHGKYQFLANVSDNSELEKVNQYGFDGVGLYRTEMIFMNSDRPYTLEEQYEIYKEAAEKLQNKSLCFRTFDVGDDKQLSYVKTFKKGVDNYIHNPILFKTQIEALLKANQYHNIKIMFPMIYSADEFAFLKQWVLQIQKEIKDTSFVEFGIMLETQEALEAIESFTDVDFISIGTNDLVHSIYHVHRDEQTLEVNKYLNDLIDKLKHVVEFTSAHQISLSICGELAAIGPALREFIKLGVKNFSVATPAIKVLNHIYKEFF